MFEIEYEFREEDLIHFNEIQFMRNEDIQNNIRKEPLDSAGYHGAYRFFLLFLLWRHEVIGIYHRYCHALGIAVA